MVSLGKLFLVLARVDKPLASGVRDFDSGRPGDVGSATSGRRSLLVSCLCKRGNEPCGLEPAAPPAAAAAAAAPSVCGVPDGAPTLAYGV